MPLSNSLEGSIQLHLEQPQALEDQKSIVESNHKAVLVSQKDRRGLLAQLLLIPEVEDARDYSPKIKWILVAVISLSSITGPMGTLIMLPAIDDIVRDLHTTDIIVNISVGMFVVAFGVFPMWWSLMLERIGRRTVYMISFIFFVGFSIGTSLAPSIGALIALRVLQGGCSALVQAVGAGTISDLFVPQERGQAMGYYFLGPLCGPFLAPIIGGAVAVAWGWRATQWVLVIVSGVNLVLITVFLPETIRHEDRDFLRGNSVISINLDDQAIEPIVHQLSKSATNQSYYSQYSRKVLEQFFQAKVEKILSHPTKATPRWFSTLYDVVIRPTHAVVLLRHPPVALTIAFSGVMFSVVYFINMTISYEYSRDPYNMSLLIVGLLYIPNSVTYILALMVGGKWTDRLLRRYAAAHNGEIVPELRLLWNVVTSALLFVPACLIFGWCLDYKEQWVTPLIGTALWGFGLMLMMGCTSTYLVDSLPGRGATGIALNNLIRQCLAAVAIFVVEPALVGIGPGILYSILTGVLTASFGFLWIIKKRGNYYREHSQLGKLYEYL